MIDLPDIASSILKDLGYNSLYPPQEEAIKEGVLDGESMLITTPTASGKTLIALLASSIYLNKRKIVYITPLKALANEKYEEFKLLERYNAKVMLSTGDLDSNSSYLKNADIIILTNEKLDSLMRHEVEWLDDVGLFVADEVHLVGDRYRGATLEIILSKILTYYDSQLLALSATVSNADELASWLKCKLVKMDWRPVRLVEGVFSHGELIFDNEKKAIKQSRLGASIDLALDCIHDNGQALIFTETRKRAVSLALKASDIINKFLSNDERLKTKTVSRVISESDDTELTRELAFVVSNGVAFHHAGLNPTCRKIVEHYYREGLIKLITATPTLASGVNLPARRVIISSIRRFDIENGMQEISVMDYKQMCGRAGRPQYDEYGEAIIVASNPQLIIDNYINAEPEPIRSALMNDDSIKMHLLGIIASLPGIDENELLELFSNTFMSRFYRKNTIKRKIGRILNYLLINDLIATKDGKRFMANALGKLASMLYIHPETTILFRDVILAERVTPIGLLHVITQSYDFMPKLYLRSKDYEELDLLDPDQFIIDDDYNRSLLGLYSWINEHSERFILDRLGIEPGDLYRMIESADWLLYAMQEFAKSMNKVSVMSDITQLRIRVKHGIKEELLELVRIKDVGRVRARALYNAGFKNIDDVKEASLNKLTSIPKIGNIMAKKIKSNLEK
jgi:helicase